MARHVGRPTNEEVTSRRIKQMLKILIPGGLVALAVVMIIGSTGLRGLMGASVTYCNPGDGNPDSDNMCTSKMDARLLGDVNGDSEITQADADLIKIENFESASIDFAAADVNKDGKVSIDDATVIENFLNGTNTTTTATEGNIDYTTVSGATAPESALAWNEEYVCPVDYSVDGTTCIKKYNAIDRISTGENKQTLESTGDYDDGDNFAGEEENEQSIDEDNINMTLKDNLSVTDLKVNFKHNPVNITYEVSDQKIAYINDQNIIVPKKRGTTNIEITAPYENGDKVTKNITLNIVNHYRSVFNITNSNNKFFVDGKTLANDLRNRGIIDSNTNYIISAQGMIVVDKKFVVAISVEIQDSKEKTTTGIQGFFYIYDIDSKQIDIRQNSCGHSNGLTYNNKEKKILCVDGSKSNKNIIFVYPKSFITSTVSEKNSPEKVDLNKVTIDYSNINEDNSIAEHRYVNIAYDKDRDIYYLAENQKRYILKLNADLKTAEYLKFAKSNSSFGLNTKDKNKNIIENKVRFRNNQNIVYKNDYVYLINHVATKYTDIYDSYEYTSQPGDSVIYGFNVDSGERGDILYQRSYDKNSLGNTKEIQDMYFSSQAESQYILFQKSVYLTKGNIVNTGGFTIIHNNDNFDIMIDINKIS